MLINVERDEETRDIYGIIDGDHREATLKPTVATEGKPWLSVCCYRRLFCFFSMHGFPFVLSVDIVGY